MLHEFTRESLNHNLYLLAKEYRKQNGKNARAELILVGGSSVIINYGFRDTTTDLDSIIIADSNIKDIIYKIADEQSLDSDWLNDDFTKTDSYSPKLIQHSRFYKTFCNCLDVRTVDAEYLIAMKIRSARDYKHDLSDVVGIIGESLEKQEQISIEQVSFAYTELYNEAMSEEALSAVKTIFATEDYEELYYNTMNLEKSNREKLQEFEKKYKNVLNQDNITDILDSISEQDNIGAKKILFRKKLK